MLTEVILGRNFKSSWMYTKGRWWGRIVWPWIVKEKRKQDLRWHRQLPSKTIASTLLSTNSRWKWCCDDDSPQRVFPQRRWVSRRILSRRTGIGCFITY
jgi:hypothetical protein